jgi:hypothetical protein
MNEMQHGGTHCKVLAALSERASPSIGPKEPLVLLVLFTEQTSDDDRGL